MDIVIDVEKIKSYTAALLNHVHYIQHDFSVKPKADHHLVSINWTDIKERRDDFINGLVDTVTAWVYSKAKANELFSNKLSETNDIANASAFLTNLAQRKFRPGHPQGQFGELLLFNFLQHFFHAPPILRKQVITTNINLERNGADAVHYTNISGKNTIILGESKCYESKYQFAAAFEESLKSIYKTFNDIDKELDLYTYDDFIEDDMLKVATAYKDGTLPNVHFQLVCIVIYNETKRIALTNETEIKAKILESVEERCASFPDEKYSSAADIIDRIHYIFFPIWALDELLKQFSIKVGIANEK